MANPLWSDELARVRHDINEESPEGFWDDDKLQTWYCDGLELVHLFVFDVAERRGMLLDFSHDYLSLFRVDYPFNTIDQTEDYDKPLDFWRPAMLTANGIPAMASPFEKDRVVKTYTQLGPTKTQPFWSITPATLT